ncbi:MAG: hypothetical protein EDM05_000540 [Leptolyngbya sp. IPPAS B-1204]
MGARQLPEIIDQLLRHGRSSIPQLPSFALGRSAAAAGLDRHAWLNRALNGSLFPVASGDCDWEVVALRPYLQAAQSIRE